MPPKKGRRGRRGDDVSDEDLAPQASVSTEATEANQPQTLKKTSKKKQVLIMQTYTNSFLHASRNRLFALKYPHLIFSALAVCTVLPCNTLQGYSNTL